MKKEYISVVFFSFLFPLSVIQFGYIFDFKFIVMEILLLFFSIIYFLFFKISKKIILIFLLYIPTIIFSIFNPIISQVYEMIYIFSIYFLFLVVSISYGQSLSRDTYYLVLRIYALFCIAIHFFGFFIHDNTNIIGFSGVFGNPNVYGLFSSTSLVFLILSVMCFKYKLRFYLLIAILLSITGLFLSVSRSSLIIAISSFIVYFLLFFLKNREIKLKYILIAFLSFFLLFSISLRFNFFKSFIDKNKSLESDLSNGRMDLWSYALNIMNYTGLGRDFYNPFALGFHNNFLNLGVLFGKTILISNIIFWFGLLFYLFYFYFFKNRKNYIIAIVLLILVLSFWFFEVGSSFLFVWIFCMVFGYVLKNPNIKVETK